MGTDQLQIAELFYSIQGESTFAGLPCLFIRLAGCNLRCSYCDARYTWDEPSETKGLVDILQWVYTIAGVPVEITGGEPLLQEAVYPLMEALVNHGRTVLLETNGSIDISQVPDGVHIIMDIKCPGSNMEQQVNWDNIDRLKERRLRACRDEVKFVLSSAEDFYWAAAKVKKQGLDELLPVLFSPVQPALPPETLAQLLLEARLNIRLQLQLHALLWPGQQRGV